MYWRTFTIVSYKEMNVINHYIYPSSIWNSKSRNKEAYWHICTLQEKKKKKNEKVLKVVFLKFYNLILMVSIAEAGIPLLLIHLKNSL